MHFCIRACDVSALAGRNIFRSKKVAVRRLVDNKIQFTKNYYPPHNDNKKLVNTIRKGYWYQVATSCNKLSPDICQHAEQECKDIIGRAKDNAQSEPETLQNLYKRYQHLYLKDRGIVVEQIVINKLKEAGHNILTATKKERTFSKTFTSKYGGNTYTVYGCVDCIDEFVDGTRALVEIKSRKHQALLYTHEIDQLVTYLVISGWSCGYLVEYVDDKVHTSHQVDLQLAQSTWSNDIQDALELSLCDASQKILDLLP